MKIVLDFCGFLEQFLKWENFKESSIVSVSNFTIDFKFLWRDVSSIYLQKKNASN